MRQRGKRTNDDDDDNDDDDVDDDDDDDNYEYDDDESMNKCGREPRGQMMMMTKYFRHRIC